MFLEVLAVVPSPAGDSSEALVHSALRALGGKSARRLVLEEPIPESGVRCCYLKEVYLGSSRTPEA